MKLPQAPGSFSAASAVVRRLISFALLGELLLLMGTFVNGRSLYAYSYITRNVQLTCHDL